MPLQAKDIVFTRYDGRRGAAWLAESYAMLSKHRVPWLGLVVGYYALLAVIETLPWIGVYLAPIIKPLMSVAFLAAAWTQERGGRPQFRMLLQGFRSNAWTLLPLGVVLVAGISLAVAATSLIDGGRLLDLLYGATPTDADPAAAARQLHDVLASPSVEIGMLFGAIWALPTILALWWAPALVVFQDARLTTALAASLRAALANWRAVLRYALVVFLLGGVVPSLVTSLVALIVPAPFSSTVAMALLLPYLALFIATLHISDYVSYRDVFHAGETLAPAETGSER
ncbi:MAG TPA: BPSS1780 family membrane protein [Casimicrobiaceae bacterium]|nr:BPSS1780 family membrane protein [Casimicrobiaceae bacterium]